MATLVVPLFAALSCGLHTAAAQTPGLVTTLAGGGLGHADGVGTAAAFNKPGGVTFGPGGAFALVVSKRVRVCVGCLR